MTQTPATRATVTTDLLIGGEPVATAGRLDVHDPASPDTRVGRAACAGPTEARRAVDAAQSAFPHWSGLTPRERADAVMAALPGIAGAAEQLAELLTRETGKVLAESLVDVAVFVSRCRNAARLAESVPPETVLPGPPFDTRVERLASGVVTVIVPFNWPLAITAAAMPYALIAGNSVIVKPPPTAPLATTRALELMATALPPGVLNVVTGTNEGVEPLLTDPRVRHVVFTGSTGGGRAVMRLAARPLARLTLELGGNDPAILLDDVELNEATVGGLVSGTYLTTGQVCMAIKRLYVPRTRYAEVVEALGAALERQRIGHGLDPRTTMGPVHTARQRKFVGDLLAEARARGAEVKEYGSGAEDTPDGGHFLRPSLVLDPAQDARVVTEEQFGPTLPVIPYDALDPLVERLNGEWSGLCSSVWSSDLERADGVARRLRTGTTWINQANAVACDDRAPFGGFRQSGMGREMGPEGLLDFTEPHVITRPAMPVVDPAVTTA
jgi:acyl-CoA reductase-like NAD-dependent aldehyde dehydrogenase